jgi:glutamyl-tRNA reductase
MHSSDHDPIKQEFSRHEVTRTVDNKPELEATIASLKQHFEAVRLKEVKRVRGRLGELSSTQEDIIESLTLRLVDQILETPITVLQASEKNDSLVAIKTVHRVFSLATGEDGSLTV